MLKTLERLNISKRSAVSAILALVSALFLSNFFDINESAFAYSNSILSIFAAVGAYFLFESVLKRTDRRLAVISVIVGFLFSAFLFVGRNIVKYDSAGIYSKRAAFTVIAETPLFAAVVAFILLAVATKKSAQPKLLDKKNDKSKKAFFITWILIFIAWLPALAASYPGIYAYDSVYQIAYYKNGRIELHHPLIHTYMLGIFVDSIGMGIFGSYEVGMFIYSIVQMICMSAAFAYIFIYIRKRFVNPVFTYGFLLIFMFLPPNALLAISSTKDVIYSALFAIMIACICKVAENPDILKKPKFLVAFSAVSFAQMIFRSQGKYIFAFAAVVMLIAFRRYWKQLAVSILSVAIVFAVYSGPLSNALHAVKSDSIHEMMSVPCVQLSRAAVINADQLSKEELLLIKEYIPNYEAYYVTPAISDLMKNTFNSGRFSENPSEFIKLWLSVGIKSPKAYVDSWARLSVGLWYPDMNYRDSAAYHPYWEYESAGKYLEEQGFTVVDRQTPSSMQWLADFYRNFTYNNIYNKVPVFSMLFSSGLPFWLLLIFAAYFVYAKKYRYLVPALVIFALWGTLLLGPVVLYRYIYPMMMSVPIMASTLAVGRRQETQEKVKTNG